jgi:hypothetical protein
VIRGFAFAVFRVLRFLAVRVFLVAFAMAASEC